jgi:glycosyltransferase involved in cell wall biosynthesis
VISIVVPAHNEEQVIGRCLGSILRDARPGEFELIVVTNGCTDRTAEVAASFGDAVTVVDCPIASKPAALNAGDAVATGFPRMYVDADIEVDAAAIRAVGEALEAGAKLAAPRLSHELAGRPWPVRAYIETWARLPYVADEHVGSGFYGLSAEARALFGSFPDTMAEDFFIRSLAPASERRAVADHTFVVHPPYTLRSLTKIRARMFAANAANRDLFARDAKDLQRAHVHGLAQLARQPANWPGLAVYLGVVAVAKGMAARKNRSANAGVWERDTTARTAASGPGPRELVGR